MIRAAVLTLLLTLPAVAEERGPVTNLPIPRYVSLKASEANARRGPSTAHRIDWVFKHRGTPLQIVGEFEHWRRVTDRDGQGGWVHYSLLSGVRTVLITQDLAALHTLPQENAPERAQVEAGAIADVRECLIDWCELDTGGYRGWMPKTAFWGVDPAEIIE
ncbi:MAG: SH3 domain-containing protein [Deltaproteobacteria bacterium]